MVCIRGTCNILHMIGDYIDTIHNAWWGNYELLEYHHSYIQWYIISYCVIYRYIVQVIPYQRERVKFPC